MPTDNNRPDISIIIPTFNEEGNLSPLLSSIHQYLSHLNYEILVVDDGSTDGTPQELEALARGNSRIRILSLKRNFGQTAAMAAGLDNARGEILIPMDADGQNDPKDIPELLRKMREGYDVVSGWRRDRKDKLFSRKMPSMMANALISRVTGVYLHDYGCTLKAYRRSVIANIPVYGEMHRFLPAWCAWQGGRVTEIPVTHHPRTRGHSKYGMMRIFKVIIDLITLKFFSGYLAKPNYIFSGMGFLIALVGFLSALIAIADKFGPDRLPQYRIPLLLLAVFLGMVAVSMFLMGLLAELLVRIYFQSRDQKPYRLANE